MPQDVIEVTQREVEIIEVIERGPAGPAGAVGPQGPAGSGGVTSVTGTAPIVSSGGTTPAISVTVGSTANTVCAGDDARLSDARTPTAHTHAAADVTSGTFDNARINFAAPSSIGSTTPAAGTFTTLAANNGTLTASAPVLDLSQTWNNAAVAFTGLQLNVTNTASANTSDLVNFQIGGVTQFRIRGSQLFVGQFTNSGIYSPAPSYIGSTAGLMCATQLSIGNNLDTILIRDGASGALAQRNGAVAQTFRLYNTFTDASNYERGFMRWSSNVLQIGSEAAGTGSVRELELYRGATRILYSTSGLFVGVGGGGLLSEGVLRAGSSNAIFWNSRSTMYSDADSRIRLANQAGTDFDRLQFGGTTSSFPALKRSSTALQVRLADDSAFAPLISSQIGIGVASPERPLHIQTTDALGRIDRVGTVGPAFLMVRMATLGTVTSSWVFGPATGFASVANDDFAIIDYATSVTGTSGTQRLTIAKSDGQLTVNGNLNLSTKNLVTDTTTGTKIGTGTTQKLGFFNATPVVQQAAVADATDAASTQARLNDLLARLRTLGLIAT